MAFNDTISTLTGTSTFYDWYLKENNEIISKLNLATVSSVTGGDGILAGLCASSGLVTVSIGGTSGLIQRGITFSGDVTFLQNIIVPNISYKITGITSGATHFQFGSVVRVTDTGYTLAQANSADSAEVIGIISNLTSTHAVITTSGKIEGNFQTIAGSTLSPGCVYFLDAATAGRITITEPSTLGQVSKPVIIGLGETAGVVVQYRGNYLNASESGGATGINRLYITFSKTLTPQNYGFTFGTFLSYAPDLVSGSTFFNKVLVDTGRTAINGWFLSGSKNYIYRLYEVGTEYWNLPNEEDFIVGMLETVNASGSNWIYHLITQGTSTVIPRAISTAGSQKGPWCLSGATYNVSTIGATGQLAKAPSNNNDPYSTKYQVGFVFDSSPSYWHVNPRPISGSPITSAFRNTQLPENLTNGLNYAFNGDFSIWQRDTGKSLYTTYGTVYFADNWIRRQAGFGDETLPVQSLQRKTFSVTDTSVEGNPDYYIDIKCLENPTLGGDPASVEYSVGHVIDNIETFNGSNITVSLYAQCTFPNYTANVYFARYSGGSRVSKQIIGTIDLQTAWTKHTLNYDVPSLAAGSYSNDYVEIGIDLNPLINEAYDNSISTSTNIVVSLASMVVYDGTYTSPPHQFEAYTDKLKKAHRYYYTTYTDVQTSGTKTLIAQGEPTLNTFNFTYLPNSAFGIFKLPVTMRATPTTITAYSPFSGLSNEMFNYTAGRDLRNTTGTVGYNNTRRYATPGVTTVSTSSDKTTVRVNIVTGAVPYDVINCHLVVDGSYPA